MISSICLNNQIEAYFTICAFYRLRKMTNHKTQYLKKCNNQYIKTIMWILKSK